MSPNFDKFYSNFTPEADPGAMLALMCPRCKARLGTFFGGEIDRRVEVKCWRCSKIALFRCDNEYDPDCKKKRCRR